MSKEKFQSIIKWVIRIFILFLIICYAWFYNPLLNGSLERNIFYKLGAFAELLAVLIILTKGALFESDGEKQKNE